MADLTAGGQPSDCGGGPPRVVGFPPLARSDATVLILGSMPGQASLAAGEYYAHVRNSFWRIFAALLGFPVDAPYTVRVQALVAARIAVWDVLHSCQRIGSLDAGIDRRTAEPNDFSTFFRAHPAIECVAFNGGVAEQTFRRQVLPAIGRLNTDFVRLPSTSPAHASLTFDQKLSAWARLLDRRRGDDRESPILADHGHREIELIGLRAKP